MDFETLSYEIHGRVAVIRLSAPSTTTDAFSRLAGEIAECCRLFRADAQARVLVILGQANSFALGTGAGTASEWTPLTTALVDVERPILAAMTGDAVGRGLELALACDVRIAVRRANFSLPQVAEGLMPHDGGTQRLVRTVGRAKAMEIILTGDPIDSAEALRIGLVSRVVPADEVEPTVMKMAHDMAAKSPVSLEYCKEAICRGLDLPLDQGLRLEADLYFLMHSTRDREEGITAFKEKRTPDFTGD